MNEINTQELIDLVRYLTQYTQHWSYCNSPHEDCSCGLTHILERAKTTLAMMGEPMIVGGQIEVRP